MADQTVRSIPSGGFAESQDHFTRIIENDSETFITGRYLSFKIHHFIMNAECVHSFSNEERLLILMEIEMRNHWNYILFALNGDAADVNMVDTEGYQHQAGMASSWIYIHKFAGRQTKEVELKAPDIYLEAGTRTRGWLCFDVLAKNVFPVRIIKRTAIFSPGHTSGVVKHYEIMEFILPRLDLLNKTGLLSS